MAELDIDTTLVLADIPGLIEGAHRGVGLGDAFLRHIQRTRVLIHMLDGFSEDPMADFSQINTELALFDEQSGRKTANGGVQQDRPARGGGALAKDQEGAAEARLQPMAISALARTNVTEMLWKAAELLQTAPVPEPERRPAGLPPAEDPTAFSIERSRRAAGCTAALERAASMTYWEYEAPVRRFQRMIETLGVDEALRKAGVQEGDMVYDR